MVYWCIHIDIDIDIGIGIDIDINIHVWEHHLFAIKYIMEFVLNSDKFKYNVKQNGTTHKY